MRNPEPRATTLRTQKRNGTTSRRPAAADLHVHTTHSDGVCSPCEVVVAAAGVGLTALAITDHDTLSAIAVARPEAGRLGVELVAGVELTAELEGREVHILGHFVRDDDPELLAATTELRLRRAERLRAMVGRLGELGLAVDVDALARAFPRATLGRRHLADWLVRTGQVADRREAFGRYLADDGPAHVPKPRLPAARAIALIRGAGGVAGLAHPPHDLRKSTLQVLVDSGLGAVEVAGPAIDARRGRRYRDWAGGLDLVPIAGSDFHAADRPRRWLGSITTPGPELERLRRKAAGPRGPAAEHPAASTVLDPSEAAPWLASNPPR